MTEKPGSALKIALLQMKAHGTDIDANADKAETYCREAARQGAGIALMPEMWSIGYTFYDEENPDIPNTFEEWAALAVGPESAYVRRFRALARELKMAIGLTYLEAWEGRPRNTISLIDRHGEIVLTYAKVHTCEFDMEKHLTPGDGFPVAELDTAAGPVKVGAMICYDREFPESARVLMMNGAELVLVPNACDWEINRSAQLRARAYENMFAVAMANYPAPGLGHSVLYDGMAFGKDEGSRDMTVIKAGDDVECVFTAPLDLDALRAYRNDETWGNAYRRPRLYGALTDEEIKPPFVRPDATR
jgi:predicted amidohydrolase